MLKTVDGMLSRMRGLKRKLADLEQQSERSVRVVQTRLDHLAALPASMDSPEYHAWARRRLSHHLVDYFHRMSPPLKESAKALAAEEGIEDLVDDELWDEMAKVERGLDEQSLDEILSWVGENRTALKKTKVRPYRSDSTPQRLGDLPWRSPVFSPRSSSPFTCKPTSSCVAHGTRCKQLPTRASTSRPRRHSRPLKRARQRRAPYPRWSS